MRSKPENIVFHWKINILIRIGDGDELYFYETNPNGENQDARLQYVVKKARRREKQNEPKQRNRNRQHLARQAVSSGARKPKPVHETVRLSDPIRLNPVGSDPIRVRLLNSAKTGMRPIKATRVH